MFIFYIIVSSMLIHGARKVRTNKKVLSTFGDTLEGVPKGGSIYPQALKFSPKLKNLSPSPYFFENLSSSLMLVKNNLSPIL